jgi:hypothetical protein
MGLPRTLIREGLLLGEEEPLKQQRLTEVRRKIDRGIEQLDRGEVMLGAETRARRAGCVT